MIEIIAVLFVMAVFITIIATSYRSSVKNELVTEMDGLKASLRYAQIQALNDDTATSGWGIHFSDATSYVLYKDGVPAIVGGKPVMIPVKIPDTNKDPPPDNTHTLQGNVKVTIGQGTTITYNKWGSSGATLKTIELSQGETKSQIAITPETGFIYVP